MAIPIEPFHTSGIISVSVYRIAASNREKLGSPDEWVKYLFIEDVSEFAATQIFDMIYQQIRTDKKYPNVHGVDMYAIQKHSISVDSSIGDHSIAYKNYIVGIESDINLVKSTLYFEKCSMIIFGNKTNAVEYSLIDHIVQPREILPIPFTEKTPNNEDVILLIDKNIAPALVTFSRKKMRRENGISLYRHRPVPDKDAVYHTHWMPIPQII